MNNINTIKEICLTEIFLEKLVKWTKLPYYVSWFLVAEFLFLIHFILLIITSTSNKYLILNLILSVVFAWIIIEVIWAYKRFDSFFMVLKTIFADEEFKIKRWYISRLKVAFSYKGILITGFIFVLVFGTILFKFGQYGFWLGSEVVLYYDYFFYGLALFAGGMSQYIFYSLSIFIYNLAKLPFKNNVFTYSSSNITYIGKLLLEIGIGGIGLLCLASLMVYLSPLHKYIYFYYLLLLFLISAIFWFFFFFLKIHKILLVRKHARIDAISVHMEKAIEDAIVNPNSEIIKRVKELKGLLTEINKMPVWPFNMKTLLSFLSTVIIPIIIVILQIVFR